MFNQIQPIGYRKLLFFLLVYITSLFFWNLVFFNLPLIPKITELTNGWIQSTLIANGVNIFLFLFIFLGILLKLKPRDLFLQKSSILPAVGVILIIWIVTQILLILFSVSKGSIALHSDWYVYEFSTKMGSWISQIIGNAFIEEVVFRAVLISQIYLLLGSNDRYRERKRIILAVIYSQFLFALSHIPNRIYYGYSIKEILINLVTLFIFGILFALIFIVTKNIYIAIGIHAFINEPLAIIETTIISANNLLLILSILLIVVWSYFDLSKDRI